jgi:crossover junction endodeoxyribonuclease RuvC
MPRILGIDPGLRCTGWGIVDKQGSQLRFVGAGIVQSSPKAELYHRLMELSEGLHAVIAAHHPDVGAIEETFATANGASTLKLGQARGALILTMSQQGLPVHEYAATLVKKTVVGVGRAEKGQVIHMVRHLLPGSNVEQSDAADALAVAICHSSHATLAQQL